MFDACFALPILFGCVYASCVHCNSRRFVCATGLIFGTLMAIWCSQVSLVRSSHIWFVTSFVSCCLENRCDWKKTRLYLASGAITSVFIESCYLLCYKFVCFVDICFKNLLHIDLDRIVTTGLVWMLFLIVLILSFKFSVVRKTDIKLLSMKPFNVYLSLCGFFAVVLLKCYVSRTSRHTEFYEFMWTTLLFAILMCFIFYVAMQRLSRLRAIDRNYAFDVAVSKAICSSECCSELHSPNFEYEYERDKILFTRKLGRFGIDYSVSGYSQLLLCLIILKDIKTADTDIDKIVVEGLAPFEYLSIEPIFTLLDNMVKAIKTREQVYEDAFEQIDSSVKTGTDLLKFVLNAA